MGDVVNLRRIKKLRVRAAAKQSAVESRVRAGRTEAQKANDRQASQRDSAAMDGKRRARTETDV